MGPESTVSVIIPAYNAARYLGSAIDACLAQTLPPHEIIVVDDGSKDETPDVCARYGDRIVAIRQANKGEAGARNTALAVATGEFIALLDADDTCSADRFEKQVIALHARPNAIACYSGHWVFTDQGTTGRFRGQPHAANSSAEDFAANLQVHPITMMFRRRLALGLEFPVGVYTGGDMIFTGLLRRRGEVIILPDVLYGYRRHDAQITASGHDLDSLRYRLAWLQEHAARVWPELDVVQWEVRVWHAMASWVKGHYWARRRSEFHRLKQVLNDNWPTHVPRSRDLDLRWYPGWLWNLKGALDEIGRFRKWNKAPER
jgi:glycosyltransferase involved in cell wall biosynthesis